MPRETTETKVIYRLDRDNPMDDSEVLILGGAGRYTMAGLRRKAAREANDVATELAQRTPNYDSSAYMLRQLSNTVATMQAALAELAEIKRKGGVRSRGIAEEHGGDPVADLEQRLREMAQGTDDLGYDSIDGEMWKISGDHGISPHDLHDSFVAKHGKTPDEYAEQARTVHSKARLVAEALRLHVDQRRQGTGTNMAWLEVTRALIGQGHARISVNEAVDEACMLANIKP